jgi:hypothetical protein
LKAAVTLREHQVIQMNGKLQYIYIGLKATVTDREHQVIQLNGMTQNTSG